MIQGEGFPHARAHSVVRRGPEGGARFAALAENVSGYGGRGVNGAAYTSKHGHLFADSEGGSWWIIFQALPGTAAASSKVHGDILACSESDEGDEVQVRVLATGVLGREADAAFRDKAPATYEEAAAVAASLSEARATGEAEPTWTA